MKTIKIICQFCNKEIKKTVKEIDLSKIIFCSKECENKYYKKEIENKSKVKSRFEIMDL